MFIFFVLFNNSATPKIYTSRHTLSLHDSIPFSGWLIREIRQWEAFAAVSSTGSVTAAGRLLDRAQPMVSRQIQGLEQELGFILFTRTRPQVTLTEQGREFYEKVPNVLAGPQQLDSRSRELATGQSRPLRVAAPYTLGSSRSEKRRVGDRCV